MYLLYIEKILKFYSLLSIANYLNLQIEVNKFVINYCVNLSQILCAKNSIFKHLYVYCPSFYKIRLATLWVYHALKQMTVLSGAFGRVRSLTNKYQFVLSYLLKSAQQPCCDLFLFYDNSNWHSCDDRIVVVNFNVRVKKIIMIYNLKNSGFWNFDLFLCYLQLVQFVVS